MEIIGSPRRRGGCWCSARSKTECIVGNGVLKQHRVFQKRSMLIFCKVQDYPFTMQILTVLIRGADPTKKGNERLICNNPTSYCQLYTPCPQMPARCPFISASYVFPYLPETVAPYPPAELSYSVLLVCIIVHQRSCMQGISSLYVQLC